MPTFSMSEWPIPKSWDEFETILWDLLRGKWQDPNAARNGRLGQSQNGVDIYGQRNGAGGYIGVQCKLHGRNGKISLAEIQEEIHKAEGFKPPLKEFHIATTTPRDAKLLEAIRLLSEERRQAGQFSVYIQSWDDIEADLIIDLDVAKRHYPQFFYHDCVPASTPYASPGSTHIINRGKLQLFVSSRIKHGLKRERLAVISALEDTSMARAWHWERDGYTADEGYLSLCSRHVHSSDGLVLILGKDLSPNVMAEYIVARTALRPCYAMVKDGCRQDDQLQRFLEKEQQYLIIRRFKNLSELKSHVIDTISSDIAHSWRLARAGGHVTTSPRFGGNP
ncbi:MAG: hypothetical protein ACR2OE_16020 [Thermomicrobiales bacterium]